MGKMKSYESLSGNKITHFDEHGNKIGVSYKSSSGKRITHFDARGNKSGTSWGNDYGRFRHYDNTGSKTGTSYVRPSGVIRHFDDKSGNTSTSYQNFFGGYVTNTESKIDTPSRHTSTQHTEDDYTTVIIGCLSPFIILGFAMLLASLS